MSLQRPLVRDLKSGQPQAWRWFVGEFHGPVTGYAKKLGHADPEEVTGSTFETIARRISNFEGGHSELRSFVFSVAHARIVDDLRKSSRISRVDLDLMNEVGPDLVVSVVDSQDPDLLRAIGRLSDEMQQMIYLRYTAGLTTKETARSMGKSEVATRVGLSRAMVRLREVLQSSQEGIES
jgi:RNA polymerase sigma-70 factor (ECF subfamily)